MNNKLLMRWFGIVVLAIVVTFFFEVSLFTVQPGQVGVIVKRTGVSRVVEKTGTHWKVPNQQIVLLDARNQMATINLKADNNGPASGSAAARFSVVWKIDSPAKFYQATQDNNSDIDVQDKFIDASKKDLSKLLAKNNSTRVFTVSKASATQAFEAAIKPVADKLGIKLLSVSLTNLKLSEAGEKQITDRMLATNSTAQQRKMSNSEMAVEKKIADEKAQAANILATARSKAASIRGESEAKVAEMFAQAAKPAPGFFRFYQTLMSEKAALNTNTRLFVVSTDSPWFQLMGKAGSNPKQKF